MFLFPALIFDTQLFQIFKEPECMNRLNYLKATSLLSLSLLSGCATEYTIVRSESNFLRRMPQINRIDPGRPLPKGSFSASVSGSYSLKQPDVMVVSDSNFESRSSTFGDEFTIVTSSVSYCYESRVMASADAMYGCNDYMAFGLSLDATLGAIQSPTPSSSTMLRNDGLEGSVFLRFAKQFGVIALAIRPELVITNLYGNKLFAQVSGTPPDTVTATKRVSTYAPSIRSSSVLRYDCNRPLAPFVALTLKSQPFPTSDSEIDHEVALGLYGGVDVRYRAIAMTPYLTVPLGSTVTHYRSPIAAGLQLSFILNGKNETK
jgi:hypothetical protein